MKLIGKIIAIVLVIIIGMGTITFATESKNLEDKEIKTNEYLKLKELKKESEDTLIKSGISKEARDLLKEMDVKEEYSKHIKKMASYSDSNLMELGYQEPQIFAIRNYDGSEEMTVSAASSVAVTTSKLAITYVSGSNTTYYVINYSFQWEGQPFWKFTDAMAFSWSEGMYVNTLLCSCNLVYKDWTGNVGKKTYKTSEFEPDGAGNVGGVYEYPVLLSINYSTIISSGSGTIYLFKIEEVPMIGLRASYAHKIVLMGSPSISFPAGASIGFGFNTQEAAYSLKYWYLQ